MKKSIKIFALVILIPVAAFAFWKYGWGTKKESVQLQTQKVQVGNISIKVTATGTVQPVDTVAVGTQVSGTIAGVYADFNSTVKKGQLLAVLDRSLLQANVNQSEATLAEAQSQAAYQKSNFNRQSQLYNVGAISKADYEAALNQYNTANATVKSSQAQLQSAQKNLSYTQIYSPIDGVVLSRNVSVGQTVAASFSTPTLFSIAKDITKMEVQASVDEADIGHVQVGQRATFKVDAFVDEEFKGTVEEIRLRPTTSSNVVTYTTLISVNNAAQKLKPGMTATVTIYTEEANNTVLIPAKALKYHPDSSLDKQYRIVPYNKRDISQQSSFVWVRQGNEIIQKEIKTGLNDNTEVQVLEGLTQGDEIITGTESAAHSAAAPTEASPFMPKRPSGNNRKSGNPGPPPR
jgi:HlyD family secretion protein